MITGASCRQMTKERRQVQSQLSRLGCPGRVAPTYLGKQPPRPGLGNCTSPPIGALTIATVMPRTLTAHASSPSQADVDGRAGTIGRRWANQPPTDVVPPLVCGAAMQHPGVQLNTHPTTARAQHRRQNALDRDAADKCLVHLLPT